MANREAALFTAAQTAYTTAYIRDAGRMRSRNPPADRNRNPIHRLANTSIHMAGRQPAPRGSDIA